MPSKSSTALRQGRPPAKPVTPRARPASAPAKAAAKRPPAHDVVSALQAEHRYAALLLDLLEERLATVARGEPLDREAMLSGMTYMTQHLDGYHHLREDAMFALLAKRDPKLAKSIAKVKREHRTIGAAGKRLVAELQRLAEGRRGDEAGVIAGVDGYVGAMRAHMDLEEGELFRRAREVLDATDFAEIDRAFMRVIDPIFEASVRDAYAAYSPVVRYLAEQPVVQQAVGALDSLLDSAATLGEAVFGASGPKRRVNAPASPPARAA